MIQAIPRNSTIRFDFLSSLNPAVQKPERIASLHSYVDTYIMLDGSLSPLEIERRLEGVSVPWPGSRHQGTLRLQALGDIYFDSSRTGLHAEGNPVYSYLLGGIAILVLIVAVVNYASLSVGRSFSRVREVGMRKASGGLRTQLARQFLAESVLLTLIALGLGLALAELFMPGFNSLINRRFALSRSVGFDFTRFSTRHGAGRGHRRRGLPGIFRIRISSRRCAERSVQGGSNGSIQPRARCFPDGHLHVTCNSA